MPAGLVLGARPLALSLGNGTPKAQERHGSAHFLLRVCITEVSCFQLSHEPHNRRDQGILRRFVGPPAIATETLPAEVLCEPPPQVGEGIFGALRGRIPARRRVLQMRAVDPGDSGRRHAEIQVIGHGIGIAGLRLGTADLLLDLAKSGFNFPARAIIFNNLRNGEVRRPIGWCGTPTPRAPGTAGS